MLVLDLSVPRVAVFDIAGVEPQAATDGISFYPTLEGNIDAQDNHPYLYLEFNEWGGPVQALRTGEWKGIRAWNDESNDFSEMKLYNLETDLREVKYVSQQYPEVAAGQSVPGQPPGSTALHGTILTSVCCLP